MTIRQSTIAISCLALLINFVSWFMPVSIPADAAGPTHALQVGQIYEVMWGCNAQGCAVEFLTIARVEKNGWAQDTKGYWFHEQNMMAYRAVAKLPEGHPPASAPIAPIRVAR